MIPPHSRLEGPQYAGWTPRVTSPAIHEIQLEAAVPVPLSGGVTLRGDVYRPRTPGRFPALLSWSAYPRYLQTSGLPLFNNEAGVTGEIVPRGYAHVLVNARGIEGSQGEYDPWFSPQEQRDMAETIAWIAGQPWCDGNIGMSGISYFGISQLLAAAQRPPALKAIFPYDFSTDLYRHILYHGGLLSSEFDALYAGVNGSTMLLDHALSPNARNALSYLTDHEWVSQGFARISARLMPQMMKRAKPKPAFIEAYARVVADEPYGGAWYDERSPTTMLDRIEVPAVLGVTQGAVALHQFGPYDAWHRLPSPRRLFIAGPDSGRPWKSFQEEMLAWYDHQLKGIDNGYDQVSPVRYWVQGANTWRQAEDWPIPGSERRRLFLRQTSGEPAAAQALSEQVPDTGELAYLAVPNRMTVPRTLDQIETQVLRFISEPVPVDTEMAGPITLALTLSSTAIDTYVVARLSDLAPDGTARPIAFGYQRAAIRDEDTERSTATEIVQVRDRIRPLTPGEPVTLRFSLTVGINLFRPDHRFLLEIGSRSDLLGASLTEGFIYFDLLAPPYPARNRIFTGPGSVLEFSVRPG